MEFDSATKMAKHDLCHRMGEAQKHAEGSRDNRLPVLYGSVCTCNIFNVCGVCLCGVREYVFTGVHMCEWVHVPVDLSVAVTKHWPRSAWSRKGFTTHR